MTLDLTIGILIGLILGEVHGFICGASHARELQRRESQNP